MKNLVKNNRWIIFYGLVALFIPMLVLNFGMDLPWFDSLSNADDAAWLGFWGGYLGAIVSIGGLYWQTNKQIKIESRNHNEDITRQRDQYYNESRVIFMINMSEGIDYKQASHNYMSKECKEIDINLGPNWPSKKKRMPVLQINNFSDNPMLAVKVLVFNQHNRISDTFHISRIEKAQASTLITTFSANWFEKSIGSSANYLGKYDPNDYISKIKLYYTTNKGEQVRTEFTIYKNNNLELTKTCNQYQQNQENMNRLYSTDSFTESQLYRPVATGLII